MMDDQESRIQMHFIAKKCVVLLAVFGGFYEIQVMGHGKIIIFIADSKQNTVECCTLLHP